VDVHREATDTALSVRRTCSLTDLLSTVLKVKSLVKYEVDMTGCDQGMVFSSGIPNIWHSR